MFPLRRAGTRGKRSVLDILIAEDEPSILESLDFILRRAGWSIQSVTDGDAALAEEVAMLRARGEIVVTALPGHDGTWNEAGCDRQLVKRGDRWAVVSLQGE